MAGFSKPPLPPSANNKPAAPATFGNPPRPPMPTQNLNRPNPPTSFNNPPRPPMVPPGLNAPRPPMPNAQQPSSQFGPKQETNTNQPKSFAEYVANNSSQNNGARTFSWMKKQNNEQPQVNNFSPQQSQNQPVQPQETQYINDLKTLEKFYRDNEFSPILARRYEDYELDWQPPTITAPKEELISQLKYYDDLKKYEQLDERQLAQVELRIDQVATKLVEFENYEYYKKFGHEKLCYNNEFSNDVFRRVPWYQRENTIKTYEGYTDHIDIALPKEKYWLTYYNGLAQDDVKYFDDVYVNNVVNEHASNDLLNHPMFNSMNVYGSNMDLSTPAPTSVVPNYPETRSPEMIKNANNAKSKPKQEKKHWWSKKDKNKDKEQVNMQNNNPQPKGFPQKQNPTPPTTPNGFPQKQNPTPPPTTPNGFPPKNNPNAPKPGGFGTQPNIAPQQTNQFFGYQK